MAIGQLTMQNLHFYTAHFDFTTAQIVINCTLKYALAFQIQSLYLLCDIEYDLMTLVLYPSLHHVFGMTYHLNSAPFLYLPHRHCQSQDIRLLYSSLPGSGVQRVLDARGQRGFWMSRRSRNFVLSYRLQNF